MNKNVKRFAVVSFSLVVGVPERNTFFAYTNKDVKQKVFIVIALRRTRNEQLSNEHRWNTMNVGDTDKIMSIECSGKMIKTIQGSLFAIESKMYNAICRNSKSGEMSAQKV